MASRGIRLVRKEVRSTNHWHLRAFRLRIEAADACGPDIDPNIFIYRRHPPDPETHERFDEWCAVVGPVNLAELPVDDPPQDGSTPFFRKSFIEVDVRSADEAKGLWETVRDQVNILLDALERLDNLETVDDVWLGACPTDSSESASESESESESES